MKHITRNTRKFVAAGGAAFGLACFGLFAGPGTAAAFPSPTPDTGTYDDQMDLAEESCWGGISSQPVAFQVGDPDSAGCEHSRMNGTWEPPAAG